MPSTSTKRITLARLLIGLASTAILLPTTLGIAYEDEPIRYSNSVPDNRVTRLQQQLNDQTKQLAHDDRQGYLAALLREWEIPVSSQVLVFSQTSIQRPKISPPRPRAVYFTDDAYVGFVQDGLLEIAVADPQLGVVFYTLDNTRATGVPQFRRGLNECLTCHGALKTRNVPGVQVRSLFVDEHGEPIVGLGTFRVNHSTPLENRWGGWYVTGTLGAQRHFGNLIAPKTKKRSEIDNTPNTNLTDLSSRVDLKPYLSPHSDLVALLVLEHQVDAQNLLTRANFECRQASYEQQRAVAAGDDQESAKKQADSRIAAAGEELVRYLLFCGEASLTSTLHGTSTFHTDFVARGPRDHHGRSLREFDLERRIFRYPCSYEVYSDSFRTLPPPVRDYVRRRFSEVLYEQDKSPEFAHLSSADRRAIREILAETLPSFPLEIPQRSEATP